MAYSEPGETRSRVLAFVRDRLAQGSPPTVREVQEAFGFRSVQSAREHLEALVAQGLLAKEPHKARAYRMPGAAAAPVVSVPLLGRVAAGPFTTAVEDAEGMLAVRSRPRSRMSRGCSRSSRARRASTSSPCGSRARACATRGSSRATS